MRLVTFQQAGRVSVGALIAGSDPWPHDTGSGGGDRDGGNDSESARHSARIYDLNQPALRRVIDHALETGVAPF